MSETNILTEFVSAGPQYFKQYFFGVFNFMKKCKLLIAVLEAAKCNF